MCVLVGVKCKNRGSFPPRQHMAPSVTLVCYTTPAMLQRIVFDMCSKFSALWLRGEDFVRNVISNNGKCFRKVIDLIGSKYAASRTRVKRIVTTLGVNLSFMSISLYHCIRSIVSVIFLGFKCSKWKTFFTVINKYYFL